MDKCVCVCDYKPPRMQQYAVCVLDSRNASILIRIGSDVDNVSMNWERNTHRCVWITNYMAADRTAALLSRQLVDGFVSVCVWR